MDREENKGSPYRRWQFAWCEFFERGRRLVVHGKAVKIEPKMADLLVLLLTKPQKTHHRDTLLSSVWSHLDVADESSLTTAILKLRRAFGGERDAIILNIPSRGYRMAVPVVELPDLAKAPAAFRLSKGDLIPLRPQWRADRLLGPDGPHPVWLAENKFHEVRVFKFATTLPRLRALERERTVSRYLHKALPGAPGFVRLLPESNLEQEPYFLESEFGGDNLLDWSTSEHFAKTTVAERVLIAVQLIEAVAAAHSLGILHNDLKPSNVLILRNGGNGADALEPTTHQDWGVKVIDFGLARLTDPDRLRELAITRHGFDESTEEAAGVQGTLMYLAPEMQVPEAVPSVQADVYALGVLLYQLICGDFVEPPLSGWESRIEDPLLRQEIAAATHRDRESRTATAAELAGRLRSVESRRVELERAEREARERAAEAARAERDRRAAEQARMRRPWIVAAMLALIAGAATSLWFAHRANQALKLAKSQSAILQSMNDFLVRDLLAQSNPLLGSSASNPRQVTLVDAIEQVLPDIDRRFAGSPESAGRLHEAIGGALDARTDYAQAVAEFARAAEQYRKARGELSDAAIIAELRRENTELRTGQADQIADANASYEKESELIAGLPTLSADVQGWQAFVFAGVVMRGPNPAQAIPILQKAVERADVTPGFNPNVLINLKLRLAPIYLALNQGANAEQVSRQSIELVRRFYSVNSRAMFQGQMFLEEALFTQGKYEDTITQGRRNVATFTAALGTENQLTMAAMINVAEAEGALERYPEAIRDEESLYEMEQKIPSGQFLALSALNDVATDECRSGQFASGSTHAHQLTKAAGAAAATVFVNTAKLSLAECLLEQAEIATSQTHSKYLSGASELLDAIDVQTVTQTPGYAAFPSLLDVDKARFDFLMGDYEQAKKLLQQAAPELFQPQFDRYAKRHAASLQTSMAQIR